MALTPQLFTKVQAGIHDYLIERWRDWIGPVLVLAIFIVIVCATWYFMLSANEFIQFSTVEGVMVVGVTAFVLALIIWFLIVFSGVTVDDDGINRIILFCYVFTWVALVGSIAPYLAFPFSPELHKVMNVSPLGIVKGCSLTPDGGKAAVPLELACGNQTNQWLVNIGGVATETESATHDGSASDWPSVEVQGGLVVPLYFIALALMGAAVSMTRRVPEYQGKTGQNAGERISNEKAREYLVLQIMQVVSAPLIAITAYHLISPETKGSTVLLGFVSGFASETILLYIRAAASKLQPAGAISPEKPAVTLSAANIAFGDEEIGKTSTPKSIALTNNTQAPVTISDVTVTGDFASIGSCKEVLAPGSTCSISITFTPKSEGDQAGVLTIKDDAPGGPRLVRLKGKGLKAR